MKKTKLLITASLLLTIGMTATACSKKSHKHEYATVYSYDDTYHWYAPTCGDTDEVKDKAQHIFNSDNMCTVCGYEKAPEGPTYKDVKITVTATGIDEWSGTHSTLWVNTSIGATAKTDGTGVDWQTLPMTQDSSNENVWSITFTKVETDANYKYNIYYGDETAPDWTNGKNTEKGNDESWSLQVTDAAYEFNQAVTFAVPTASYSFTFKVYPTVKSTADAEEADLNDTTCLWMWNTYTKGTDVLTKADDGSWTYEVSNVATFQATCVLGSSSAADWSYQVGEWEDGVWQKYNNGYTWDAAALEENIVDGVLEYHPHFQSDIAA